MRLKTDSIEERICSCVAGATLRQWIASEEGLISSASEKPSAVISCATCSRAARCTGSSGNSSVGAVALQLLPAVAAPDFSPGVGRQKAAKLAGGAAGNQHQANPGQPGQESPAVPPLPGRGRPQSDPHGRARGYRHSPASAGSGARNEGAAPEPQLLPNSPRVEGNDSYTTGSMPVAEELVQAVGIGRATQQHILTLAHG